MIILLCPIDSILYAFILLINCEMPEKIL